MQRILVVANRTLGGEALMTEVRGRLAAGPCRFHILVPATHPNHGLTWSEGEAVTDARERLDRAMERFREAGTEPTGEVGDASPVLAVLDALPHHEFDEVIVSTLPAGISRWLRMDLPRRVAKLVDVPVTHVVTEVERV